MKNLFGYRGPGTYCFMLPDGTWPDFTLECTSFSDYNQKKITIYWDYQWTLLMFPKFTSVT